MTTFTRTIKLNLLKWLLGSNLSQMHCFFASIYGKWLLLVLTTKHWFISIGKPWTLQYFVQHLLTKLLIFPTLFNGCRCNKETLTIIKQAGFKTVQAEKGWLQWSSEAISKPLNPFTFLLVRSTFAIVNSGIAGFAEKWLCVWSKVVPKFRKVKKSTDYIIMYDIFRKCSFFCLYI